MKTLEEIKNVRNGLEGYVGEEYDYKLFKNCECMLRNISRRMEQVVDVGMHTSYSKEELRNEYKALEENYNKLYEDIKPIMLVTYDGYKTYSKRCKLRYANVKDYRHGEDYFLNQLFNELFNN